MLRDRLFSASILISVLLTLLWLDHRYPLSGLPGVWLIGPLLLFALGTAREISRLLVVAGRRVDASGATLGTAVLTLSAYVPVLWPLSGESYPQDCPLGRFGWVVAAVAAAVSIVFLRQLAAYQEARRGESLEKILCGVFIVTYVGLPFAILALIRGLGQPSWGLAALISMIVVTKSADTGAYFTGKLIGRKKLVPHLSPGKTWEGALGGIGLAILASYLCFMVLMPAVATQQQPAPPWGPVVFGLACALFGMVGDLSESLVKREAGVKDSGRTLPGLGGIWDVTDSLVGTAMPAWLALLAGVAGS